MITHGNAVILYEYDLNYKSRSKSIEKLEILDFKFIPELHKANIVIYNSMFETRIIKNRNGKTGMVIEEDRINKSIFNKLLYKILK